jgi:glycosyltransferase involved in cell wall biosynthesis
VSRPLISIVTPSYNHAAYLEETILSVLEHDYEPIEYIVVDDGSTDSSVELIERYADRLAWWTRQENRGQAAALNRGFARSSGEYMGFLNSDDTLLPGAVTALVDGFAGDEDVLLVYGDAVTVENGRPIGRLRAGDWDPRAIARTGTNPVPQQGSLWRRRAWELAGPFDEQSFFWFELEFLIRLSAHGRARRLDRPLGTFRLHAQSKTVAPSIAKAEDTLRVARSFFRRSELPPALRREARRGRASLYFRAGYVLYQAAAIRRARRAFLGSLALAPAAATRLHLLLLLKTLIPEPIVRRRRARRR